jgi:hypothetical protein
MIRVLFLFVILFILIYLGILSVQKLTGKQAIKLMQIALYATISSSLAIMLMLMLVYFF